MTRRLAVIAAAVAVVLSIAHLIAGTFDAALDDARLRACVLDELAYGATPSDARDVCAARQEAATW